MTVTLNKAEVLHRAYAFAKDYASASYEMGQAQNFIRDLCEVFGFSAKRLVSFEQRVKKSGGSSGRMDGFYPGKLLIEMKSRGADLQAAYQQALDYLPGLQDAELPAYILVSDFEHLHLYRRGDGSAPLCHTLAEFPQQIDAYLFLAGFETQARAEQISVNESAARNIAQLHDAMRDGGYHGADLERYLVRLLFCLFAEDTAIFDSPGAFSRYVRQHTREDGSDLDGALQNLFDTLNRAPNQRPKNLPHELRGFPYINGSVFAGQLERCYFDSTARSVLLHCAEQFDWSQISPAIFGSLFQAVIHHDDEGVTAKSSKRRELGAHYTSEINILRVIGPLFLHALQADLKTARGSKARLKAFLARLRGLHFFDPACGCGNFLVLAYREIRRLELDAVEALLELEQRQRTVSGTLDAKEFEQIQCDVHQCHGIEIEASAAHIATVALWLTDHQENLRASQALGGHFNRLPLVRKANIVQGNALTLDWAEVLPPTQCSYVIGNPPFVGAKFMSDAQREDTRRVLADVNNAGLLDLVAAWYVKAARYLRGDSSAGRVRCAFVSTNSITQGEQVGVLWGWMLAQGIKIQFAHRTFQWSNDAKGVAAVHCVIVGFGLEERTDNLIYHYPDIRGEPVAVSAQNINPYLVDAPDVVLPRRSTPLCNVPEIGIGNKPIDGGHYLFTTEEKEAFLQQEPSAAKFFRRWLGADEFLNGYERWCLWLGQASPNELRHLPKCLERIQAVKALRLASKSAPTRKLAETPTRFHVENIPDQPYLVLPEVSSERRAFVPFGFEQPETLCSNLVKIAAGATLYHFGILCSTMHNAWMRAVCGRLKSDYRYSKDIVYNNFPWPDLPEDTPQQPAPAPVQKRRLAIAAAAQAVLDARAQFADSTLADLYDPLTMPVQLSKAHQQLDKAVDAAYGYQGPPDDTARVAFLFARYQALTAATAPVSASRPKRRKA
ncbi:MAG: class I SAM-dependent DNA methyltransferase [Giesbergeria sp.]|uniref:DNA methyltransferase n=1 Tax=Giesbergeria sp. TaxID=2818473 RepID=UPI0026099748|nr:DNA methyltransferase [Giesbergeria sp.]MDD2609929.1 class I SAM-dependent DNA methyltransferase [Giesbergeria sp.]